MPIRQLVSIIKMEIIGAVAYPADVFLFVISGAVAPIIALTVWLGVYSSGGHLPMSLSNMTTYYIFLLVIEIWNSAWASSFISRDIRMGQLSKYLVQPASYFAFQFGTNIGEKIFKMVFLSPIVIILVFIFGITWPNLLILMWLVFLWSWIASALLMIITNISIGLISFWMDDTYAIDEFNDLFYYIFSGRVIPIIALPAVLSPLAQILPFRYMLSLPLEILTGQLTPGGLVNGLLFQGLYLILAFAVVRFLWIKGLKRYSAVGN